MSRMLGAVAARLRLAVALVVGCAVALLMPPLLTTAVDPSAAVVVAAVAMAVASVVALNRYAATSSAIALAPPPCTAWEPLFLLGGRVTDPVHHPLRPRAPGLA